MLDPLFTQHRPLRIGHMGAGGLAPGNSLAAIDLALRIGVDLVELDVWQTADGHLVLGHLPWIRPYEHALTGRLARPRGWLRAARTLHTWPRVSSSTLAELRRLPSPPPTLGEALDLLRGRAIPYLDLRVTGVADGLCRLLRDRAPDGALLGSGPQRSFLPELALMPELVATSGFGVPFFGRALSPASVAGLTRSAIRNARRKGATGLSVEYHLVQPALLDLCAQEGFFVFAWTVNHPAVMCRLASLGVAGITSDRPDLFRAALRPEQAPPHDPTGATVTGDDR